MKQLLDYVPLIIFFIVYKMEERLIEVAGFSYNLGGIFSATEILILSSIIVYGGLYLVYRKLERNQLITLGAVLVFCTFTILFREEAILKWKAPIVNWIFAAVFLGTQLFARKNATELMLGHAVSMPDHAWRRLNFAWIYFFIFLGAINLFVAFTFHDYWVDFKVFGSLAMIFLFIIGQTVYMLPYLQDDKDAKEAVTESTD